MSTLFDIVEKGLGGKVNIKIDVWYLSCERWDVRCEMWDVRYEMWASFAKVMVVKESFGGWKMWDVRGEIWDVRYSSLEHVT